jgi:hypothetical protein
MTNPLKSKAKFNSVNTANTLRKYNISEDQKFYYPYDRTFLFNESVGSNSQNEKRKFSKNFLNKKTETFDQNKMYYMGKIKPQSRGRSTSKFFKQFENIQNRFNTQNLNDFLKVYKSQEPKRKFQDRNFKYNYDSFIESIGSIDPKGEYKLDTVKNIINAPDPKSSFFRTKDNHFVRKDSDKFFIDERLKKRNKEIISQRRLQGIIDRENKIQQQKENLYRKNESLMEMKRKKNLSKGILS